jgi:hypothetical protein
MKHIIITLAAVAALAACSSSAGSTDQTVEADYAALGVPAPPASDVCSKPETRDAFNDAMKLTNGTFDSATQAFQTGAGDPQRKIEALMEAGEWTDMDNDSFAYRLMADGKFMKIAGSYNDDYETVSYKLPSSLPPEKAAADADVLCKMNLDYYGAFQRVLKKIDEGNVRGHEVLADYLAKRTSAN